MPPLVEGMSAIHLICIFYPNFNNFSCDTAAAVAAAIYIVLFFNDMDQDETVLFFNNMDQNSFVSVQVCKGKGVEVQSCNVKNISVPTNFVRKIY